MEDSPTTVQLKPTDLKLACKKFYSVLARTMQDDGWFDDVHEKLCDFIQYHVEEAQKTGTDCRICITMPRGALKSTIVTKYLSAWLAVRDPNVRILLATNSYLNATKKLEDIKGLFESHPIFTRIYPELLPTKKNLWTAGAATINRPMQFPEATFEAAGMGTKKTGSHYNVIFEDDTTAPDISDMKEQVTAPSSEDIEQAIGWHKQANNLLVPKGTRIRIIVSTRWADYDLIQYVKDNENYYFFDMPALNDKGEANFSMFYSKEKLKDIESQIGPYMFSCLYLNRPMDASKRKFQKDWFTYVEPNDLPIGGYYSIAVDPAISEKDDSCETAITCVYHWTGEDKRPYMCWYADVHAHLNPLETATKILNLAQNCLGKVSLLVETVAYQKALKYILHDEMIRRGVNFDIVQMNTRTSKNIRIESMVPYFANKRIKFLKGHLTPQVESQLVQFPHGKLVDVIDSFSMHIKMYKGEKVAEPSVPVTYKDEFTGENILKEIRAKSVNRRHQPGSMVTGVSSHEGSYSESFNYMQTGLGITSDTGVLFRG